MTCKLVGLGAGLLFAALTNVGLTADADPHHVYESKCKTCHSEHGADLARLKFKIDKDGLVVSRTGQPVARLLSKHHGVALLPDEQSALAVLFTNGIKWKGVFQHRCYGCHGRASDFARSNLEIHEGRIVVKGSRKDIAARLSRHGEATPEEALMLIEMLRYQLETAPRSAQ